MIRLSIWHLDLLRASALVPLPRWIREKKAVVNDTGTGDDCFKWAAFAGMHPVDKHEKNPNRMNKYEEHVNKCATCHLLKRTLHLSMCMV